MRVLCLAYHLSPSDFSISSQGDTGGSGFDGSQEDRKTIGLQQKPLEIDHLLQGNVVLVLRMTDVIYFDKPFPLQLIKFSKLKMVTNDLESSHVLPISPYWSASIGDFRSQKITKSLWIMKKETSSHSQYTPTSFGKEKSEMKVDAEVEGCIISTETPNNNGKDSISSTFAVNASTRMIYRTIRFFHPDSLYTIEGLLYVYNDPVLTAFVFSKLCMWKIIVSHLYSSENRKRNRDRMLTEIPTITPESLSLSREFFAPDQVPHFLELGSS
ncbi:hypothetical protein LXL04_027676 [Taraxacum kok-saghyz]